MLPRENLELMQGAGHLYTLDEHLLYSATQPPDSRTSHWPGLNAALLTVGQVLVSPPRP